MAHYLYVIGKGEFEISIKSIEKVEKEPVKTDLVGFLRPVKCHAATKASGPVK